MQTRESRDLVRFLTTSSRTALGEFLLARMNKSANLERQCRELLRAWCEEYSYVLLAQLLREHGEELVVALGSPRRRRLK